MKPIEATRRGVLAMGLGVGAPLLPVTNATARTSTSPAPDFSECKDGIAIVIAATLHHAKIPVSELLERRRVKNVVLARQIGMYVAWTMTNRGLIEIGRRFGNRDHTTVLEAVRKISRLAAEDPAITEAVEAIGALCVEPMRSKGAKITVLPISSSRLGFRLNTYDGAPWNV